MSAKLRENGFTYVGFSFSENTSLFYAEGEKLKTEFCFRKIRQNVSSFVYYSMGTSVSALN